MQNSNINMESARVISKNIRYQLQNLRQLVFEITDKCNLKCEYCGYGKFFALVLLVACVSCHNTTSSKTGKAADSLLYIKLERGDFSKLKPLLMSDFVDSIRYIQLETSTKCLLPKEGGGLTLSGNFIFSAYRDQLYQFDMQGNFIRQIGRLGKGPGEFALMSGRYGIDETNKKIFVSTKYEVAPLSFDFDGNCSGFVRDSTLASCWGIISRFDASNGYLIFVPYPGDSRSQMICRPYELIVFDYDKKEIVQSLTNRMIANVDHVHQDITSGLQFLGKQGNQHFYKAFYNDTLYTIINGNIQPYAIIDLGSRKYPADLLYSNDPVRARPGRVGKILIDDIFVHHHYILLFCYLIKNDNMQGGEAFICKYDIPTGTVSYHSRNIVNDLDGGANISVTDLIRGVNAVPYPDDDLSDEMKKRELLSTLKKRDLKYPEEHDKFLQMQKHRKENDNPLLMTWHLK